MGIRGLTTFIETNKDIYLQDYQLRDTHLVIDGNNLCAQLYKYQAKCNDMFGGDYDKYAVCIRHFFAMLKQCDVTPIVIMDGGYEIKKMRTVYTRLRERLKAIKESNPIYCFAFPLFVREVFKDVVARLGVAMVRCDYEADLDIASIARKLDCPVLSYDSDFYIFDVKYIPFLTVNFSTTKWKQGSNCIRCKLYKVENFLERCRIDKSLLPLMATLLGNDYVEKRTFKKFFNQIKITKRKQTESFQYRSISSLIYWLRNETYNSAVTKILQYMKKAERTRMQTQIKQIADGYVCVNTELLNYLGLAPQIPPEKIIKVDKKSEKDFKQEQIIPDESSNNIKEEIEESSYSEADKQLEKEVTVSISKTDQELIIPTESLVLSDTKNVDDETNEEKSDLKVNDKLEEDVRKLCVDIKEEIKNERNSKDSSTEVDKKLGNKKPGTDVQEQLKEDVLMSVSKTNQEQLIPDMSLISQDKKSNSQVEEKLKKDIPLADIEEEVDDEQNSEKSDSEVDEELEKNVKVWDTFEQKLLESDWFRANLRKCNFPSMFVDVLTLGTVIYQPQIQDFRNLHSLDISLPIIRAICKILLSTKSETFIYLAKSEHAHVTKYNIEVSDLELPTIQDLEHISPGKSLNTLLKVLEVQPQDYQVLLTMPQDWQLYFLIMIFWVRNAVEPKATHRHVCSLVLCLLNLNIVDKRISYSKVKAQFMKKYGPKLKGLSHATLNCDNPLQKQLKLITNQACLCFAESFLTFFALSERTKSTKKFSLYAVEAFGQFQSCLLYAKHLNALLNFPLKDFDISSFYNGTFIYNMYMDLEMRKDPNRYIEILMIKCPIFWDIYQKIDQVLNAFHIVPSTCGGSDKKPVKKKPRRRKPRPELNTITDISTDLEENEENYDVNNKFSILRLRE